jgi:hypothetical protein
MKPELLRLIKILKSVPEIKESIGGKAFTIATLWSKNL